MGLTEDAAREKAEKEGWADKLGVSKTYYKASAGLGPAVGRAVVQGQTRPPHPMGTPKQQTSAPNCHWLLQPSPEAWRPPSSHPPTHFLTCPAGQLQVAG